MASGLSTSLDTLTGYLNRLAKWLLLAAVLWLCWTVARIIWLLLAAPQAPNLPVAELQSRLIPTTNTGTVLAIFDTQKPKPIAVKNPTPKVSLTGVMIATPSSLSSAMLEVNGNMANYRIGEVLPETGYKLIDVVWNKVIIEDDSGHSVVLEMPQPLELDQRLELKAGNLGNRNSNSSTNNKVANSDTSVSKDRLDATRRLSKIANNKENDSNLTTERTPQDAIATAVNELKQNPASYLSRMGVMATGEGYQVTDAMPAKLKSRLGLESGDRVISVNGNRVGSNPMGDADLLQKVKKSGEAQIEVKRGEQTITIRQQF